MVPGWIVATGYERGVPKLGCQRFAATQIGSKRPHAARLELEMFADVGSAPDWRSAADDKKATDTGAAIPASGSGEEVGTEEVGTQEHEAGREKTFRSNGLRNQRVLVDRGYVTSINAHDPINSPSRPGHRESDEHVRLRRRQVAAMVGLAITVASLAPAGHR
jgi:hypothetical protein